MSRQILAMVSLALVLVTGAFADLVFPASFEMVEETPGHFRISLTLPMVQGRFIKARPILPDIIRVEGEGEPATHAGSGSITRTWQAGIEPGSLSGSAIGLEGLLGTAQEVRFLLSTLDGRRHEVVMRPTRPFFLVPHPPRAGELAAAAVVREGLRLAARQPGLWFLLAGLLVLPFTGLSDTETHSAIGYLLAGWVVAAAGMAAIWRLCESLLSERAQQRLGWSTALAASTWMFYQAAGLVRSHGPGWRLAALQRVGDVFVYRWLAPFGADWAMARLRIPWVSLVLAVAGGWVLLRVARLRTRFAVAGALLALAVAVLPWGSSRVSVPFMSPKAPNPVQARRILEPMLSRIYHALNLEDENQTYDRLPEQVSGELITDLYLDSRRRLISGTREGASVTVRGVAVLEVGSPYAKQLESPGVMYPCRWTVTAKVTHWQHSHERRNLYEGDLCLAVEDDRWKLAGIDLHSEEREVVPGSFSSR